MCSRGGKEAPGITRPTESPHKTVCVCVCFCSQVEKAVLSSGACHCEAAASVTLRSCRIADSEILQRDGSAICSTWFGFLSPPLSGSMTQTNSTRVQQNFTLQYHFCAAWAYRCPELGSRTKSAMYKAMRRSIRLPALAGALVLSFISVQPRNRGPRVLTVLDIVVSQRVCSWFRRWECQAMRRKLRVCTWLRSFRGTSAS